MDYEHNLREGYKTRHEIEKLTRSSQCNRVRTMSLQRVQLMVAVVGSRTSLCRSGDVNCVSDVILNVRDHLQDPKR
jgi:hypothetical protein